MTDTDWAALRRDTTLLAEPGVLALDKPAGVSVTGERHGTDLVRMAADAEERLYPVHRIDKATSGLVLLATALAAHGPLTRQFQRRTVEKWYLAVTPTRGLPDSGEIDLPLATGRKNRIRVAAPREAITRNGDTWRVAADDVSPGRNYPSLTRFRKLWQNRESTLLAVSPVTGRRHQIRVHLAWIGHPITGDPLFGESEATRTALHSWRLSLDATWRDGSPRVTLVAPPGPDFWLPVPGIDVDTVLTRAEGLLGA
ncbi:tRNA pseudouridine32 synthase / 23S rRNA pseudouridine746 synthase [Stackebrandtia albiflava]|uniref:RNA pseudouridylate synthase n=1 Tax=Stackebrandtia albiflava TaxID=406432 RepID=A0A562V9Y9_9ACTN|nr:RNA pseudouridine synthase [Stackebrandtia albiflava]TWJ14682.1 tRNA pseudouridine32 synthase / 23S rRNA pseudouridine746 synthase [Stackebrandtia albiflava]